MDPPQGSTIYTIGVLESRIGGSILEIIRYTILYTTLYYMIPYHTILWYESPELGVPFVGSKGSGQVLVPRLRAPVYTAAAFRGEAPSRADMEEALQEAGRDKAG